MDPAPPPPLLELLRQFRPGQYWLGELLVGMGVCAMDDVASALEVQSRRPGRPIGQVLIHAGACSPAQLEQALAWQAMAQDPAWTMLPRLQWHPGVVRSEQVRGGQPILVLGVPAHGRYLRLGPGEFELAGWLLEEGSYAGLLERAWREREQLVPPEAAHRLLRMLVDAGIWADGTQEGWREPVPRGLMQLLGRRWPLADPTRGLDAMLPLLRVLCHPGVVLGLWGPLVLVASWLAWRHWAFVGARLEAMVHLASLDVVGGLLLATFLVVGLHELGHAAIARVLGAPVRQVGIMLYLGMPLGYCDASGADLLPSSGDRIRVSLGGLYFQIAGSAAAMVLWAAWPGSPPVFLLDLVLVGGGSILFDLNPLVRMDGYYVLVDALDETNLRERSFAWWRAVLRGRPGQAASPRQARRYAVYGVAGALMTAAMVALALYEWGGALAALARWVLGT